MLGSGKAYVQGHENCVRSEGMQECENCNMTKRGDDEEEQNQDKRKNDKENLKDLFLKYGYGPILLHDPRFERVMKESRKEPGRTLTKE